ncbi:MAG: hypothetical protein DMD91_15495 [Candidatus Rokuibacteriota bacterium]|nr:MAG: hypothetical protein DMD91_15495 [Candidatus Rokubacteria bacterium]
MSEADDQEPVTHSPHYAAFLLDHLSEPPPGLQRDEKGNEVVPQVVTTFRDGTPGSPEWIAKKEREQEQGTQ